LAYTNATFHIDDGLVSGVPGSDAVRSTIASVVFSNPSGTTVRGTKVAHGLVTGAVVTVSGCTQAYANDVWKITKQTADTFDLDGALWASFTGADVTGDVVPFGGSSWTDAWATITSGATAARIAPGDTVKIAKSPAPTSLGTTATWTNGPLPATQSITSSTNATPVVVTLNSHGYVNGDIVQVLAHATNTAANGTWVVANKTANTFELAGSVGNGVGGATGTVQNVNAKAVVLGTAQTKTVDLCNAIGVGGFAWTLANTSTVTLQASATDAKEGGYSINVSKTSPATSTLYAYRRITSLDVSGYQKLSFWIKNSVAIADTARWKICLCSDTAGATPVDTFLVPAIPSTARWVPLTLTKSGGGDMGAAIQSIAIYTGTSSPGTSNISVDDFVACTTSGLNLQSLISKNSAEQGGAETWYGLQSINGKILMLDTQTATKSGAGRGYSGTTETVTTYKRETIKTAMASSSSTNVNAINDSGSLAGGDITFSGGWDSVGGVNQGGETMYDGLNGFGTGVSISVNYVTLTRLCCTRYNNGVSITAGFYNTITTLTAANNNTASGVFINTLAASNTITTLTAANNNGTHGVLCDSSTTNNTITTLTAANNNGTHGVYYNTSKNNTITTLTAANNNGGHGVFYNSTNNNTITTLTAANNNGGYGVCYTTSYNNLIQNGPLACSGNVTAQLFNDTGTNYINNATLTGTETIGANTNAGSWLWSHNHDATAYHWGFTDGGTINSEATDRAGGTGSMWRLTISSSTRSSFYPIKLYLAKIACNANKLVTVKAWMKKSHATDIVGKLVCRGGQLAGVAADVTATKASDTSYEQLTITFTPTETGVIEIEAWAYYVNGQGNVVVEDMTITQAA